MTYDLIIVSASRGQALIDMTQRAIDSCLADSRDVNVILIETGNPYKYQNVNLWIEYNGQFNYNRALNIGLKHRRSDIQILANNDIYFYPGWSHIGDIMHEFNYLSASAISNSRFQANYRSKRFYEGYGIGLELSGWCIFTDDRLWNIIGALDESHQFWFSDNAYADQLKKAGIKHVLIPEIKVYHLLSQTLKKTDRRLINEYTSAEVKRFRKNNT